MALIKCKECGHMISDKATRCPKCGAPSIKEGEAQFQTNMGQQPIHQQPVYYEEDNVGNNNKWLYAIIALLLAAMVGGSYYFYDKNKQQEKDYQQKLITDSIARDSIAKDSIAKVEQALQDSIEQVRFAEEKTKKMMPTLESLLDLWSFCLNSQKRPNGKILSKTGMTVIKYKAIPQDGYTDISVICSKNAVLSKNSNYEATEENACVFDYGADTSNELIISFKNREDAINFSRQLRDKIKNEEWGGASIEISKEQWGNVDTIEPEFSNGWYSFSFSVG